MLSPKKKVEILKKSQLHATDTGSVEAQTSILTARILELTDHLKTHKKDLSSRMGLMKMVAERRKLLTYLKRNSLERYSALIEKLDLKR